jgi:Ion channel
VTSGVTSGPDMANSLTQPALRRRMLREAARASDSYGLLLLVVVLDYIVLSGGWTAGVPLILSTALTGITALLAFHTSHARGHLFEAVQVAAILAFVASIVATIVGGGHSKGVVFVISALLILTTPVVILSRILKHRQVTVQTLLGAVCVYILLGLVFSYSDYAVQLLGDSSFFAQSGTHNAPDFVYYSYITITTVGYGDLTPAVGFPRTMAVLEALTGQIFLVVLVARLVSMYQPKTRGARLQNLEQSTLADSVGRGSADSEAGGKPSSEDRPSTAGSDSENSDNGDSTSST